MGRISCAAALAAAVTVSACQAGPGGSLGVAAVQSSLIAPTAGGTEFETGRGSRRAGRRAGVAATPQMQALIARYAALNGVPEHLVHKVIRRESGYNARAAHAGNLGLMQIRHATARGVGYGGSATGLLDAETNLTYGVRYLAGAYRAAGGNEHRAESYYRSGYYYAAKRMAGRTRLAGHAGFVREASALPGE
jgi:soluble lytic murein transglycosylase-like protein